MVQTGSDTVQTGSDTVQTRVRLVQTRFKHVQTGSETAGSDTVQTTSDWCRQEKKLRRSEKGRRESTAVDRAKDAYKYSRCILLFGTNSIAPPSHHPSITFTQPLQPYRPLPSTLPPTPFHLLHHLSAPFSFVGGEGEGKRLWRSGEARRRESQEVGQTLAHAEKQWQAYTLHCVRDKMPWPALCFVMAPPFLDRV